MIIKTWESETKVESQWILEKKFMELDISQFDPD